MKNEATKISATFRDLRNTIRLHISDEFRILAEDDIRRRVISHRAEIDAYIWLQIILKR